MPTNDFELTEPNLYLVNEVEGFKQSSELWTNAVGAFNVIDLGSYTGMLKLEIQLVQKQCGSDKVISRSPLIGLKIKPGTSLSSW